MHYVYVLKLAKGSIYTGSTSNLRQRMKEHSNGKSPWTKSRRPVRLIYYEAYLQRADAIARERYLKTGDGRQTLKKQLQNTLSAT